MHGGKILNFFVSSGKISGGNFIVDISVIFVSVGKKYGAGGDFWLVFCESMLLGTTSPVIKPEILIINYILSIHPI